MSRATSATWNLNPADGNWTTGTNWSGNSFPNGPADTATFGISNLTNITLPPDLVIEVNGIVFEPGASAYTITGPATPVGHGFVMSGTGITNNSGVIQNFVLQQGAAGAASLLTFSNSASAGTLTLFTIYHTGSISFLDTSTANSATFVNKGGTNPVDGPGVIYFRDGSSADHGTFTNGGGSGPSIGALIFFSDNASAGNAVFTNEGSLDIHSSSGGTIIFHDTSTASNGTIINNGGADSGVFGGGNTQFSDSSTAGSATLIANGSSTGGNGGAIVFLNSSTGDTARVEVFGNGYLNISPHATPDVTIGSLEGSGLVFLGANNLTVGSNNMSTNFSGGMQDGGPSAGGIGGSLTKTGSGTLTLSGANIHTGSTTVNAGRLIVNGSITSAVTVNGGTLGGSGTTGGITVNSGGTLAPGNSPGILSVAGNLTLTMGSTYLVDVNGATVGAGYDQTNVTGMVNLGQATLSLALGFTPVNGMTFNIINNDGSDAVNGTFSGMMEGSTIIAGGQAFMITYHGGDGNDVVLSVVPEPTTWVLVSAGFLWVFGLGGVRSRRKA